MLANDPHLAAEPAQHLVPGAAGGAGRERVRGEPFRGRPFAIIGFNEQVAWGVTNTYADVLDWYQVQVSGRPPARILARGPLEAGAPAWWSASRCAGRPDRLDTVLYTHHGPVVYDRPEKPFLAPNAHRPRPALDGPRRGQRVLAFYRLNRARNYADYTAALATYGAPAQNFVFADAAQDIALWPNGRFPLKWREQGKYLLDGSDPAQDWQGWIPAAQNPHVRNPARGFVSSANQSSARPTDYPYYMNWDYGSSERARRINQRLAQMTPGHARQPAPASRTTTSA